MKKSLGNNATIVKYFFKYFFGSQMKVSKFSKKSKKKRKYSKDKKVELTCYIDLTLFDIGRGGGGGA